MRPLRIIGLLLILVAGFTLITAPAALLRRFLPNEGPVLLANPSGTLWDGRATLVIGGRDAGELEWRFAPVTILQGALGYDAKLSGPTHFLTGRVGLHNERLEVSLDGTVQGDYLNAWLRSYDIHLAGAFTFDGLRVVLPYRPAPDPGAALAPGSMQGRLTWGGGPVRYRLSGRDFSGALPPLEAVLGAGLQAQVQPMADAAEDSSGAVIPLLRIEVLANGYVRIGITRLLTKLLNNPWPGSDVDHEVVLEIEERLLPSDTPV